MTIELRKIEALKEHPQNILIYGEESGNIAELAQNINASSNVKPLVINGDNVIISGNRRYQACKMLGMVEMPVEVRNFSNEAEELECLLLENAYRMKSMEQKIREARIYEQIEAERAKQRMFAGESVTTITNPVENFPQAEQVFSAVNNGKTRDIVAKKFCIGSGRTYEKAKQVVAKIDELKADGQTEQANKLSIDLTTSVDRAYTKLCREEKLAEIERKAQEFKQQAAPTGFVDIYTTTKKYNIIYADPPWSYYNDGSRSARLHYRTMTIEEICALPVKNIAAENCALFLWVTFPLLPETFKVIESWGFKYVTCAWCWVKLNPCGTPFMGLGNWTRANAELCLLATRGSMTRLDNTIPQVLQSVRQEHSKKPEIIRDLITRLIGDLPKIELFSRQSVAGWDCWGNETL